MFNKKLFLIFSLFFLIGISLVSAKPPFETNIQTSSINGLQVFYPQFENVAQNSTFTLHIHVSNISNGYPMSNTLVNCSIHLYNSTGSHTMEDHLGKDSNGWDHEITITEGNFSDIGFHAFYIWCNTSDLGGEVRGTFLVTESGVEITEGRSILIIGLLGLLVFFLFLSLYSLFNVEDYRGKFALYWVSHVLLIVITFVGWQVGVEGLLDGTAITGIFRILFWVFTVSAFPMVLLSLAWIFYIHTMNDHVKRLVEKGEDPEKAFSMAQKKTRRKRGW